MNTCIDGPPHEKGPMGLEHATGPGWGLIASGRYLLGPPDREPLITTVEDLHPGASGSSRQSGISA